MENQQIITFSEFRKGILACVKISLVVTLIILLFFNNSYTFSSIVITFGVSFLYSLGLGFGNGLLNNLLDKKWSWLKSTNRRVYAGIIATVLYTIPVVLVLNYIMIVKVQGMDESKFFSQNMILVHMFYIILSLGISTFMHARSFMMNWKSATQHEVVQQKIIAGTASAKFESLKNQIDPHFLFNSLNVLSSLIEENPENAQKFTTSLSKIYRYVLEQKDKELVTVAEELAFAKTYMNLLKMRFEDSITFELPDNFENEEAKVVPLSLQLLLENCIKHNVVSEKKPLNIRISIKNNELIVENNKQKKEVLQDRRGAGLQNIVSRYAILSKRNVIVEDTDEFFRIKLPILTKQISVMETSYNYNEQTAYDRAKDRVDNLKGFYGNLISYCCVIPILIIINLNTSSFQWFWFPMLGWGLGLTFHALETFGYGKTWEERKIQEILQKESKEESKWN
jgi:hypothetical protein